MPAELIALTEELRATNAILATVSDRLDAADRRASRHRLWTAVLALVVAAVVVLGTLFWLDQRSQARAHAREEVASCERSNEGRADIRAAIVGSVARLVSQRGRDPETYQPMLDDLNEFLLETLPPRDC